MPAKNKEEKREKQEMVCPVGKFFMEVCGFYKDSPFFEHLNRSKIEFLKAIRSLIDRKIEDLEKRAEKKKVTKIEVE